MSVWLDQLSRLVVFPEGDVLAAPGDPYELQCVAQTKKKTRCNNWLGHIWGGPDPATCEIDGTEYEVYGIETEAPQWRAQHCRVHTGQDVVDVAPVEWQPTGLSGYLGFHDGF